MAKPSKDRSGGRKDRRAVLEQMRADQKRKERRRTIAVIAACVVVALVIVGAAAIPLLKQNKLTGGALTDLGYDGGAAACKAPTTKKATGNQDHKPIGTPIDYPDSPPAFGSHYPTPAPMERKFYTAADRPELAYVVHNLEHGYTLMWYDATVAKSKDQLAVVKAVAAKFDGAKPTDKFIALPWTGKDGKAFPGGAHVALTHWSAGGDPSDVAKQVGVWQYCGKPSGQAVSAFVKKYPYTDSPEPLGA